MWELRIKIKDGYSSEVEEDAQGIARADDTFDYKIVENTGEDSEEYPWIIKIENETEDQAWRRKALLTKNKNYWEDIVKQEVEIEQVKK